LDESANEPEASLAQQLTHLPARPPCNMKARSCSSGLLLQLVCAEPVLLLLLPVIVCIHCQVDELQISAKRLKDRCTGELITESPARDEAYLYLPLDTSMATSMAN
jgi:hypothetical protein